MEAQVYGTDGKATEKIKLPPQFEEGYRPDLIKRAVLSIRSHKMQPHSTFEDAGNRHPSYLSKRRREYKATYGYGRSRAPRKVMSRQGSRFVFKGAQVPQAVGGRQAHPPKIKKVWGEKINDKERKKAIRSAIAATAQKTLFPREMPFSFPFILETKIEEILKAKELIKIMKQLKLDFELERAKVKKIRAGRGKSRGRPYRRRVGPLFVVSKKCNLLKAASNIAGSTALLVKDLNAEALAPGGQAKRLVIWSKDAIKELGEKKLFA